MLESLRDVAVASMILSQFTIGVSSAAAGHYRDAAIGGLALASSQGDLADAVDEVYRERLEFGPEVTLEEDQ